jgi:hypothetical protein
MIDIPIQDVRVIWDTEPPTGEPSVKVYRDALEDDERYISSWDVRSEMADRDDECTPVQLLLERFVHLAVAEKIDCQEIHSTFMVVP